MARVQAAQSGLCLKAACGSAGAWYKASTQGFSPADVKLKGQFLETLRAVSETQGPAVDSTPYRWLSHGPLQEPGLKYPVYTLPQGMPIPKDRTGL